MTILVISHHLLSQYPWCGVTWLLAATTTCRHVNCKVLQLFTCCIVDTHAEHTTKKHIILNQTTLCNPLCPLVNLLAKHADKDVGDLVRRLKLAQPDGVNRKTLRRVGYWVIGDQLILLYVSKVSILGLGSVHPAWVQAAARC
jgi:hypothetical protein